MSLLILSNSTIFKRNILIITSQNIHNSHRIAPKYPNSKKDDIRDNDDPNINISAERYRPAERKEYEYLSPTLFQ